MKKWNGSLTRRMEIPQDELKRLQSSTLPFTLPSFTLCLPLLFVSVRKFHKCDLRVLTLAGLQE